MFVPFISRSLMTNSNVSAGRDNLPPHELKGGKSSIHFISLLWSLYGTKDERGSRSLCSAVYVVYNSCG